MFQEGLGGKTWASIMRLISIFKRHPRIRRVSNIKFPLADKYRLSVIYLKLSPPSAALCRVCRQSCWRCGISFAHVTSGTAQLLWGVGGKEEGGRRQTGRCKGGCQERKKLLQRPFGESVAAAGVVGGGKIALSPAWAKTRERSKKCRGQRESRQTLVLFSTQMTRLVISAASVFDMSSQQMLFAWKQSQTCLFQLTTVQQFNNVLEKMLLTLCFEPKSSTESPPTWWGVDADRIFIFWVNIPF